jgi:hypothetical protein
MRRILLLSIVAFYMATVGIWAQRYTDVRETDDNERTRFAVKVGGSISGVKEVHHGSENRIPGFNVGIALQIPLQQREYHLLYLVPEVLYSSRGERGFQAGEKISEKFYLDYISIPLMLKSYLFNDVLFVEFGPEINFIVTQKNKNIDLAEVNRQDFGLNLGGGMRFGSEKQMELGARLNYGLSRVYPDIGTKNHNIGGLLALTYFF